MNKASGGDRIPAELFQILEDDAVTDSRAGKEGNIPVLFQLNPE